MEKNMGKYVDKGIDGMSVRILFGQWSIGVMEYWSDGVL